MSSIHYKFRSSVDYDTLTFEGPNISLKDLIDAIMLQKKIGKNSDFTLEVTNAQTKEVYQDQDFMVPRNTSVVVKRVPVARLAPVTGKVLDAEGKETPDLANANATEDDKISAMMKQSVEPWPTDPYINSKIRSGEYVCFRCGQKGHYIKNCPTIGDPRYSQSARGFHAGMRGGMSKEFYIMQMRERERQTSYIPTPAVVTSKPYNMPVVGSDVIGAKTVPKELQCPMCKKLLHDAVVIPCCGISYCDECIRNYLIEHDFACPSCKKKISPDDLIPNKSLRQAVENFRNTSHLPSTTSAASNVVGQPVVSTTFNSAAATPDVKPPPKIAIKLLKKEDPKPKVEVKKEQPKEEDDTLNTSVGPITEAQLFEEIAKEPSNNQQMTSDIPSAPSEQPSDQPNVSQDVPIIDAVPNVQGGAEPTEGAPQVLEGMPIPADQAPQPSVLLQQQQQQLGAQQLQIQQQQMQLQQQQIAMQQMQVPVDAQLQPAVGIPNQVMMQQVPTQVASMPLATTMNPALPAQQIIVSGQQTLDQPMQTIVASQSYQQRIIAPGIVNQATQVVGAPVLVRHLAPASTLPVASAFHPGTVHSVVPTRLHAGRDSHISRTGSGRETLFDPLFDLGSEDTGFVPMTEEEFYRAKIKMKDGKDTYKRRSRSRSRSPRHRSRDSHREPDREMSRSRRSRRTEDSHGRSDSGRRSDRSSRREDASEAKKYESRSSSSLHRSRKERSTRNKRDEDSFDEELSKVKRRQERNLAGRSFSRSYSPAEPEKSAKSRTHGGSKERSKKKKSPNTWNRSPSPPKNERAEKKSKSRHRNSEDFKVVEMDSDVDSEEFKTVKLDESRAREKKSKSHRSKKSSKGGERRDIEGSATEPSRKSKKRKSDEKREGHKLKKIKKDIDIFDGYQTVEVTSPNEQKVKKNKKDVESLDGFKNVKITTQKELKVKKNKTDSEEGALDESVKSTLPKERKIKKVKNDFPESITKEDGSDSATSKTDSSKVPKIKGISKVKTKKENITSQESSKTSQESSHMSDSSATWDEILAQKNKKLLQKQLQKKKRKEDKLKLKKKKSSSAKLSTVEIKSSRPLVDAGSTFSESEVEAKQSSEIKKEDGNKELDQAGSNHTSSREMNSIESIAKDDTNTRADGVLLETIQQEVMPSVKESMLGLSTQPDLQASTDIAVKVSTDIPISESKKTPKDITETSSERVISKDPDTKSEGNLTTHSITKSASEVPESVDQQEEKAIISAAISKTEQSTVYSMTNFGDHTYTSTKTENSLDEDTPKELSSQSTINSISKPNDSRIASDLSSRTAVGSTIASSVAEPNEYRMETDSLLKSIDELLNEPVCKTTEVCKTAEVTASPTNALELHEIKHNNGSSLQDNCKVDVDEGQAIKGLHVEGEGISKDEKSLSTLLSTDTSSVTAACHDVKETVEESQKEVEEGSAKKVAETSICKALPNAVDSIADVRNIEETSIDCTKVADDRSVETDVKESLALSTDIGSTEVSDISMEMSTRRAEHVTESSEAVDKVQDAKHIDSVEASHAAVVEKSLDGEEVAVTEVVDSGTAFSKDVIARSDRVAVADDVEHAGSDGETRAGDEANDVDDADDSDHESVDEEADSDGSSETEEDASDQVEDEISVAGGSSESDEEGEEEGEGEAEDGNDEDDYEEEEEDEDDPESEEDESDIDEDAEQSEEDDDNDLDEEEVKQDISNQKVKPAKKEVKSSSKKAKSASKEVKSSKKEAKRSKKKMKPVKVSSRKAINGSLSSGESEDSEDERERRKKKRKEKKRKREKEYRKMKRKRKYVSEDEEDSDSDSEEEPRKKRHRKSEKKSKKHKRKHKKHKHNKKHRKTKKYDSSDHEDDSELDQRQVITKSRMSRDSDHQKMKRKEKLKREKLKKRHSDSDSNEEDNLVVNVTNDRSHYAKRTKSRTIYVVKQNEDSRNIEPKNKKTKILRTVTGKS